MSQQTLFTMPTFEMVLSVEEHVKKYSQEFTTRGLWKKLHSQEIPLNLFKVIIDYLHEEGKLNIDPRDNIVFWTYDPEGIAKIKKEGLVWK